MILCPDNLLPQGPDRWNSILVGEAFAACHRQIRDEVLLDSCIHTVGIVMGAPGAGKSTVADSIDSLETVLFDAVWNSASRRVGMAKRIREAGKRALCVWVRTPLATCRTRNNARPSWRRVPESALLRSWQEIEQCPPDAFAEGWDHVDVIDGEARR